jgi:hypothetical protein
MSVSEAERKKKNNYNQLYHRSNCLRSAPPIFANNSPAHNSQQHLSILPPLPLRKISTMQPINKPKS